MTIKLTPESFLTGFRQSGLLSEDRAEKVLTDLKKSGVDFSRADTIAQGLIDKKIITEWQADKLLQGRHKGFLLGRYRLLSLLGKGEMSAVYLAKHITMDRKCAIKVLPANRVKDTSYLGRFYREARAVAALNNPYIVSAYDVDYQSEGGAEIHYLVMEYVDGPNLEDVSKSEQKLTIENAVDYIRQGAMGLAHAHDSGLIHRDIKPGNFLIDKQGHVKLLDLGLARFFNAEGEESLTIKHDEKVLGTADFLAPEQAIDSHSVDLRADIYSLGCTLYYALTGTPPFTDGTLVQRLLAHQTKTPPSVKLIRPDIPDSLVDILEKMMAKQKEDRYQTAKEVYDALEKWLVFNGSRKWKEEHVTALYKHDALEQLLSPEKLKKYQGEIKTSKETTTSSKETSSKETSFASKVKSDRGAAAIAGGIESQTPKQPSSTALKTPPAKVREEVTFNKAPQLEIPATPTLNLSKTSTSSALKPVSDSGELRTELLELQQNQWIVQTLTGLIVAAAALFCFALYTYFNEKNKIEVPPVQNIGVGAEAPRFNPLAPGARTPQPDIIVE